MALDLVRISACILPSFLPLSQSLLLVMLLLQCSSRDQLEPESSDEVKKMSTEVAPPATLSQAPPTSSDTRETDSREFLSFSAVAPHLVVSFRFATVFFVCPLFIEKKVISY